MRSVVERVRNWAARQRCLANRQIERAGGSIEHHDRTDATSRTSVIARLVALGYIPPHIGPEESVWTKYGIMVTALAGIGVLLFWILGANQRDRAHAQDSSNESRSKEG